MNRVSLSFHKLSSMIVDDLQHVHDANYRTAVSRLYYAVFLELREQYLKRLPEDSLYVGILAGEFPKVHALIKLATLELNKDVGLLLKELHSMRKQADYNTRRTTGKYHYSRAMNLYSSLADFTKRISQLNPKRVEKAFEKAHTRLIGR